MMRIMENDTEQAMLADGRLPARIIRYRGLVKLLNYLITVARRIAIQRHRKRRPQLSFRSEGEDQTKYAPKDPSSPAAGDIVEQAEIVRKMQNAIARSYSKLSAEQQFLISMVYRQGMKQKEAGALLGWSEFKTRRVVCKAMDILRRSVTDLESVSWTPSLASAWTGAWSQCWDHVQQLKTPASDNCVGRQSDE